MATLEQAAVFLLHPWRLFLHSLARFAVAPLWHTLLHRTPIGCKGALDKCCCFELYQDVGLLWKVVDEVGWREDVTASVPVGFVRLYWTFSIKNLWVAAVNQVLAYMPFLFGMWNFFCRVILEKGNTFSDKDAWQACFSFLLWRMALVPLWLERNFPVLYFY